MTAEQRAGLPEATQASLFRIATDASLHYLKATTSVLKHIPDFQGQKFLALSLAALTYVSESEGVPLAQEKEHEARLAVNLGIKINDFYDLGVLGKNSYVEERRQLGGDFFSEEQFREYRRRLRLLEIHRPSPGEQEACIVYRENVNLISLAHTCSVAFEIPINKFINTTDFLIAPDAPPWFSSLFHLVMGLQVVDDMVGYRGDSVANRPSFFTAFGPATSQELNNHEFLQARFGQMGKLFSAYIKQAQEEDASFAAPIAMVSQVIYKVMPTLADVMRQPVFKDVTRHFLSSRDAQQL